MNRAVLVGQLGKVAVGFRNVLDNLGWLGRITLDVGDVVVLLEWHILCSKEKMMGVWSGVRAV